MREKRMTEDELWVKAFEIIAHKDEEIVRLKAENSNYSHNVRNMTDSIYKMQKLIESQAVEIKMLKEYIEKYGKKWWEKGV